jgi:hypothetical protein
MTATETKYISPILLTRWTPYADCGFCRGNGVVNVTFADKKGTIREGVRNCPSCHWTTGMKPSRIPSAVTLALSAQP